MGAIVTLEIRGSDTPVLTLCTLEGLLSCVDFSVFIQPMNFKERLVTLSTYMRSFTTMSEHVYLQLARLQECLVTQITNMGLRLLIWTMDKLVILQMTCLYKGLATHTTNMGLLASTMIELMIFQLGGPEEGLATNIASMRFLFDSMCEAVFF